MIYANEWESYPAAWLRNLAAAGEIPPCDVDERSIADVRADELRGFHQWHMFAGIGGWPIALRLAGWPDDREIFTASCPCQPFSKAGCGAGFGDDRDLWPCTHAIIRYLRPEVCMGEQVDGPAGNVWLDRTRTDLEGIGYTFGAIILPALCVNGPSRRYRWFWIASRTPGGRKALERITGKGWRPAGQPAEAVSESGSVERLAGRCGVGGPGMAGGASESPGMPGQPWRGPDYDGMRTTADGGFRNREWDQYRWVIGPDRDRRTGRLKARRLPEPGLRGMASGVLAGSPELRAILLAKGVPARAHKIRGYGNAIVPQVGAAVLRAFMEAENFI